MQYITTPHQAELDAQDQMRSWGFTDAVATAGGADGGLDVRSSRALAQVKWKGGVTGRPDVQNLYGARGAGTDVAKSSATVETPTDWKLVSILTAVLIVVLSVTILLWWP